MSFWTVYWLAIILICLVLGYLVITDGIDDENQPLTYRDLLIFVCATFIPIINVIWMVVGILLVIEECGKSISTFLDKQVFRTKGKAFTEDDGYGTYYAEYNIPTDYFYPAPTSINLKKD